METTDVTVKGFTAAQSGFLLTTRLSEVMCSDSRPVPVNCCFRYMFMLRPLQGGCYRASCLILADVWLGFWSNILRTAMEGAPLVSSGVILRWRMGLFLFTWKVNRSRLDDDGTSGQPEVPNSIQTLLCTTQERHLTLCNRHTWDRGSH